uniref:SPOR domain-containing protein n=1 Tax=Magnetococcus massalia (strain MO-1) TaxID=451514 RepID=A0A1S7LMK9_MAGMO|nr:Conserved protein of unknown function. Sporulation domain protein [Candidatus Magnetococcus massalia]
MKGTISREQQFLVNFGGALMIVIVGVVVYQMFSGGGGADFVKDMTPQDPVVQVTRPSGEGLMVKENAASERKSWLDAPKPARIFAKQEPKDAAAKGLATEPMDKVRSIKPPQDLNATWNKSNAAGQAKPVPGFAPKPATLPRDTQSMTLMAGGQTPPGRAPQPAMVPKAATPKVAAAPTQPAASKPAALSVAPRKRAPQPIQPFQLSRTHTPQAAAQRNGSAPVRYVPRSNSAPPQQLQPRTQNRFNIPVQARPTQAPLTNTMAKVAPKRQPNSFTIPPRQAPEASKPRGYSVQVISFVDNMRANAMRQRLSALPFNGRGLPAYTVSASIKGKTYHRVRLGPFPDRATAERARNYVLQRTGQNGQVINPGR